MSSSAKAAVFFWPPGDSLYVNVVPATHLAAAAPPRSSNTSLPIVTFSGPAKSHSPIVRPPTSFTTGAPSGFSPAGGLSRAISGSRGAGGSSPGSLSRPSAAIPRPLRYIADQLLTSLGLKPPTGG